MDKINYSKLDIQAVSAELSDDFLKDLKTPVMQRKGFKYNSYVITVPRYFYRFIGIKNGEEEYYDSLYKIDRDLRSYTKKFIRIDKGLDKNISIDIQNKLNNVWSKVDYGVELDSSSLISEIDNLGLFNTVGNANFSLQIKNYFKIAIDFIKNTTKITKDEYKILVSYGVYWINIYSKILFQNYNYEEINPKVLYYGKISKEESAFLIFISMLGCDILYYNPEKAGEIADIDKFNAFSKEIAYISRSKAKEFPIELSERIKTSAYAAKEELDKTLYGEEGSFYRPWQFADYDLKAVTLKTTYEEINLWAKEKSLIRDGWKIENRTVYVPNIFAKVCGTHENVDKYWRELHAIKDLKKTVFIGKLPIIGVVPLEYGKFEQVYPQYGGSGLNVEKMMSASWWKYTDIRTGLQLSIANKIKELCENPVIYNVDNQGFRDFQVDIFSVLINLNKPLLNILQDFDYPEEVPKIIIYNNEKNGNLSYEDCIMLSFMNAMGVDIIIYNPSGYNDIEKYIYNDLYDVHRLERMTFNLDFKKYVEPEKKGFFKNLFGK
ncbi:hypothetical protein IAI10_05855 [Clostridium sp. 19966]|uniref:YceG family protein n=1 Tax=Clostridium sp. 19966 TaxID=2768166 RepID=UPI0028DDFB97|nr:YceG family protein [Clostridium sp. 19966]MDT8716173.1 hypothetical protein [Clostridium sp. 19966]